MIATTAADLVGPYGPAGQGWALWTAEDGDTVTERLRLTDLPERGPSIAHHADPGQPYTEAAFDHYDPQVRDLFNTRKASHSTSPVDGCSPEIPYTTGDDDIEIGIRTWDSD